jgi:uncharacterized delta-60 repeat protein
MDFEDPAVNGEVDTLAVQPDGKVLVGGSFTNVGTQGGSGVARLTAGGRVDSTFEYSGTNAPVNALAVQADGKILVGGSFTSIGMRSHSYVARLNADGGVDMSFADPGVDGYVDALAVQADGKLLISGRFTSVGTQAHNGLARLSLPEAAVQSLDVNGAMVTWRRSGTAPELALPPILYYSLDGTDYTALGPMTRVAGGWRRSGVPTPFGFYYLRAEGRVSGGMHDASQGLVDSVRRIWRDDGIFKNGFE